MYSSKQELYLFEMPTLMPPCLHDYVIAAAVDGTVAEIIMWKAGVSL